MRICEKEKRKDQLIRENEKVEKYIAAMPDGTAKDIFEMVFLDGMTQKEVGESVGYTQSMVSKVIKDILKHSITLHILHYVIIILNLEKRQVSTLSSTSSRSTYKTQKGRLGNRPFFCYARRRILKRNRPDKDGTHRGAFEKNKKKIYATQTVCGICGKPVDFSLKYPHPLSPCIDHIIPIAKGGHPE